MYVYAIQGRYVHIYIYGYMIIARCLERLTRLWAGCRTLATAAYVLPATMALSYAGWMTHSMLL